MDAPNIDEAAARLRELVEAAVRGDDVAIALDGVPAVRLVRMASARQPRQGGFWRDKLVETDPDWWRPDESLADLFGVARGSGPGTEPAD